MRVIVLATQKGGAGKTTLCGHLAVQAERSGAGPVALIDADPQGSLADWWNARTADTPLLAQISGGLAKTLAGLDAQGIKTVFIDTPGRADASIEQLISSAHLALVPVVPSPHDLRAISQTNEMLEDLGVPTVYIVNNAGAGRLTTEAVTTLSQWGTLAPVICHTRQDYRASMIKGRTVMETAPTGRSAGEVADLWVYLETKLTKQKKGKARGDKT
jgi:chromosome partitioning protein